MSAENEHEAKCLCNEIFYSKGPLQLDELFQSIKESLDEAEKRGADKMEEIVKKRISEAVDKAAIAAQRDMRERAACVSKCQKHFDDEGMIRALPIKGE